MADENKIIDIEALSHYHAKAKISNDATYVAKETGKGLSQENYTTVEKAQLAALVAGGIPEGGGVVIAEDEIIVVEGTFDGAEVTINETDVETIKNYTGEKLMFLKIVATIPDAAFNLYMAYTMDGVFSAVIGGGCITNVLVDTTTGKGVFEMVEALSSSSIKHEYDGMTGGDTVYSTLAISQMMGKPFGFASLDINGLIPSYQLPSYVDDVVEGYLDPAIGTFSKYYDNGSYSSHIEAETGKIYIDLHTGNSYRWSGSIYVRINPDEYTVATNADIDALFT